MNLVTGGSGFLGSHLVEALVARGEDVRVLVRPASQTAHLEKLGVELAGGDLTDPLSLASATQGVARIYHAAALAADWGPATEFQAANVTGVQNLLAAASAAGVKRFIHISTTDVYGHPDYPAAESAPFRVRGWPYGDTKIASEQLIWAYHHEQGLPVTVVRPVNIYGPRSGSFVLDIVDLLRQGSMVHIGRHKKPGGITYVTNVVDLILRAADSQKSIGQAYNACDGSDLCWRDYVNRLADMVSVSHPRIVVPYRLAYAAGWAMEKLYSARNSERRPLLTRMAVDLFGTDQGFPIDKARRELGYEPQVNINEGMERIELWLREIGVL
jgi:nucleoside-diphosphate-sugar epimerase